MATVLHNVLSFSGLAVGVPSSLPHGLQLDHDSAGVELLTPQLVIPSAGPYQIAVDATNVTVTRLAGSPSASVSVWVQWSHTIDQVWPRTGLPAGLPHIVQAGSGGAVDPERTIHVSPSGGDAQTITAGIALANALVPAPSATHPAIVLVYPGAYTEAPLTVPTGVSLAGFAALTCRVTAQVATQPLVTLQAGSSIRTLALRGASGAGGVGVYQAQAGLARCWEVNVADCETAIGATGAGVELFCYHVTIQRQAGETLTYGVLALAGAKVEAIGPHFEGAAGAVIGAAAQADGAGTELHLYSFDIDYATNTIVASTTGEVHAISGVVGNSTYGFRVLASGGTIHAVGVDLDGVSSYQLYLEAASAVFRGVGNTIRADRMYGTPGMDLLSQHVSDIEDDESQAIIGNLQTGTPRLPSRTCLGQGSPHVRFMHVFRNTNLEAGTWSDITTEMASPSGSTENAFPGLGIGNTLYIGAESYEHVGALVNTTTAIALAGGSLVWEFWDGAAWQTFRLLVTQTSSPYNQYADDVFGRVAVENIRFNPDDMSTWATKALNGTTAYWVRCRISGAIGTMPILEQIQLQTSHKQINGDGVTEFFGTAAERRSLGVRLANMEAFVGGGAPGNQNLALTANVTLGSTGNVLANNNLDGLGCKFVIPTGMDTSRNGIIRLNYALSVAGVGAAIELQGHYGMVPAGTIINGGHGDTAWNSIINVNALAQFEMAEFIGYFDLSDITPGGLVVFSLYRDAQAGNPDDTLAGNVWLVSLELEAYFWR